MENKEKHPKSWVKIKTVFVAYSDVSNVRLSNYIKIIDKEHAVFILQENYKVLN